LLSTSTTVLGEPLRYPTGAAHVTSAIVTLAPGARTILHKHGVPMFAYILDGEITVDYGTHGKRTYRKGQSLMEAMHVAHFGENTGKEPMRLIAVYMGAARAKDVIPVK
jgi:quercetin dioxygenase-like cupin family protein